MTLEAGAFERQLVEPSWMQGASISKRPKRAPTEKSRSLTATNNWSAPCWTSWCFDLRISRLCYFFWEVNAWFFLYQWLCGIQYSRWMGKKSAWKRKPAPLTHFFTREVGIVAIFQESHWQSTARLVCETAKVYTQAQLSFIFLKCKTFNFLNYYTLHVLDII